MPWLQLALTDAWRPTDTTDYDAKTRKFRGQKSYVVTQIIAAFKQIKAYKIQAASIQTLSCTDMAYW